MQRKVIHRADQPGIILQGSVFQFQSLGKSGHDAGTYFFGQRVDQQLLLGADAAADQDQLPTPVPSVTPITSV